MAVLEAMGAGLPVILSQGCNMNPLDGGYVVDVSSEAIADKLRLMLTNASLRHQMGQAAQQLIAQSYTWDQVAVQLEAVYQTLHKN